MDLVLWSGGFDSTALLVEFLQAGVQVHAHHIRFWNNESRGIHEIEAVHKLLPILISKYGPFGYSESTVEHLQVHFCGLDAVTIGSHAMAIAEGLQHRYQQPIKVWLAINADELRENPAGWHRRHNYIDKCVEAYREAFTQQVSLHRAHVDTPKAELIALLPPEIQQLCFTCRSPKRWSNEPCGMCLSCKTKEMASDHLSQKRSDGSSHSQLLEEGSDGVAN